MFDALSIFHVIVAVALIIFVLLQDAKGGAMGVFGGGGSQSVFGSSGGADFLVKVTRVIAIVFGLTCLALTYQTNRKSDSKLDRYVAPAKAGIVTAPAATTKDDGKKENKKDNK
ncbi:MAG: preprotein translocase subunit SecG [Bdellovibrionaceae bacterium]|jgi:preprotein translocase subunit SecG|nr:preprotein translocase subunit SecG [Pseudobdellovibrionaceae bacterium]